MSGRPLGRSCQCRGRHVGICTLRQSDREQIGTRPDVWHISAIPGQANRHFRIPVQPRRVVGSN